MTDGEMSDEEFLNYCEAHADTPRCGFVPAQLSRLHGLAGFLQRAKIWGAMSNAVHDAGPDYIRELVRIARDRLAAAP